MASGTMEPGPQEVEANTERTSLRGRSQYGIKTGARWPGSMDQLSSVSRARYFTCLHPIVFYKMERIINLSCRVSVKIQRANMSCLQNYS